jgi:hypothetical protein
MDEIQDLTGENLDPKKLFDEKKFKTLIVTPDGPQIPIDHSDYPLVLTEESTTKEEKEEALKNLKEQGKPLVLIDAIKESSDLQKKAKLIAACWETGLDFSSYTLFFTELLCSNDFLVAMEAATVLEQIISFTEEDKRRSIQLIQAKLTEKPSTTPILTDILNHLSA